MKQKSKTFQESKIWAKRLTISEEKDLFGGSSPIPGGSANVVVVGPTGATCNCVCVCAQDPGGTSGGCTGINNCICVCGPPGG